MNDNNAYSRRSAIKIAAVASGILGSTNSASASPGNNNTVQLTEMAIEYRVPSPNQTNAFYETAAICEMPDYRVDADSGTINVGSGKNSTPTRRFLEDHNQVLNFGGLSEPSQGHVGGVDTSYATTSISESLIPRGAFVLDSPSEIPRIDMAMESNHLSILSDDINMSVEHGMSSTTMLAPREIELRKTVVSDTKVEATEDMESWQRAYQTSRSAETVSASPILHVKNHGVLEVI